MLIASASFTDRIVPLCVRQPPTQLQLREHQEHYQETFLQVAVHSTSPTLLLPAAFGSSSYQPIDNGTASELSDQLATYANTTQLVESLGGLDVVRENENSGETSFEPQNDSMSDNQDQEECPTGFDMLECEDCGGPEHTWEINHNDYHCKGVANFANHDHKQC